MWAFVKEDDMGAYGLRREQNIDLLVKTALE